MTAFELKQHAYRSTLKSRALNVFLYLIDRANKDLTCYPSISTIAAQLHISISTVKRAMKELEQGGYLRRDTRWRENGGQSSNLYTLDMPTSPSGPEPSTNSAETAPAQEQPRQTVQATAVESPETGNARASWPPVHPALPHPAHHPPDAMQLSLFYGALFSCPAWTGVEVILQPP